MFANLNLFVAWNLPILNFLVAKIGGMLGSFFEGWWGSVR